MLRIVLRGSWHTHTALLPTSQSRGARLGKPLARVLRAMEKGDLSLPRYVLEDSRQQQGDRSTVEGALSILARGRTLHAVTESLLFAALRERSRCKEALSATGLPIEKIKDYDHRTPLHLAAAEGAVSVADLLLELGAPVNAVDRFQQTPLASAAWGGHAELVKMLKAKGALVKEADELVPLSESSLAGSEIVKRDKIMRWHWSVPEDFQWDIDWSELTRTRDIGRGAFGTVSLCSWRGTPVALKVLHLKEISEEGVKRSELRTELSIMRRLHHPHVVQFLGTSVKDATGTVGIVTEFMAGGGLDKLLKGEKPVPPSRTLLLAVDCCRGMAYLHGRKPHPVLHRDLKPGNLLLTNPPESGGRLKIGDFGLSKALGRREGLDYHFTLTGETGSYRFMSPEMYRRELYGPAIDVYAFAIILFWMLTWRRPFAGEDPKEVARRAAYENRRPSFEECPLPHEVPAKIQDVIERAWSPDPADRPSFLQLLQELEPVPEELARKPTQTSRPPCCSVM